MDSLTDLIKGATVGPNSGSRVPGLAFQVIDRNGNILNSTVSGVKSVIGSEPITEDSVFYVASMTKWVTSIALMQLMEQGKVDLDSADQLEDLCPELKSVRILEGFDEKGQPILREKKTRITLRHLNSHQSGFSYTFLNEDLWRYTGRDASVDEFSVSTKSLSHPLVFEPGTSHGYGVGIQWVTVFIERFTGVTLERYFSEHIFSPLSLKSSAFFVSPKLRKSLVTLHRREEDGSLHPIEHVFAALLQEKEDDVVCSGEGGLVSTASDYAQILAAILNDGVSPKTKARILKKETIDLMFKNQVPDFHRRFAGAGLVSPRNEFIAPWLAGGLPVAGTQGWGLNAGLTGKSEDSLTMASAPGVCNTFWSMDREKGVGCVLLSQIIPLGDPVVFGLWGQIQQIVYG